MRQLKIFAGTALSCILCSLALIVAPAHAGPYEDALAAYNLGDYATAIRLFSPLAEQGHSEAQFHLGVIHDEGEGGPANDAGW